MAKKRITELATETTLKDGQYVAIDHTTDGTKKYNIGAELTDLKEDIEQVETDISTLYDMGTPSSYNNDKVPYLFRASGGGKYIGGIEKDTIVGGTVAWNQLVQNGDFANDTGWGTRYATISIADGIATFTPVSEGTVRGIVQEDMGEYVKANHKYLGFATVKPPKQVQMNLSIVGSGGGYTIIPANVWTTFGQIFTYSNPTFKERLAIYCDTNLTTSDTVQIRNAQLFDLTQLFGSTIADYIYSLEQANAGAGVAWFKKLFPKDYYAYNEGELISISGLQSHDMVGFNQFNISDYDYVDNAYFEYSTPIISVGSGRRVVYIPCLPNTQYSASKDAFMTNERFAIGYTNEEPAVNTQVFGAVSANNSQDIGNRITITTTTGANAKYLVIWAYWSNLTEALNRLSINLSWDGERDGEYEPYQKHSYPLDDSLTLRGIPKLDSSNQLYYDGDTYKSDGSVTRKYGSRAYQSGDESLTDAITDGTNTVYKLSTSTTETADPYQNPQIVDKDGTEEYVTTGIVPVGHDTDYYLDADSVLTPPSTAGTYSLKVTVASDGSKSYSWVSD